MAGNMATFNINDGYCEAIVRGYMLGLLTVADYNNIGQCERLEGKFFFYFGDRWGLFLIDIF